MNPTLEPARAEPDFAAMDDLSEFAITNAAALRELDRAAHQHKPMSPAAALMLADQEV